MQFTSQPEACLVLFQLRVSAALWCLYMALQSLLLLEVPNECQDDSTPNKMANTSLLTAPADQNVFWLGVCVILNVFRRNQREGGKEMNDYHQNVVPSLHSPRKKEPDSSHLPKLSWPPWCPLALRRLPHSLCGSRSRTLPGTPSCLPSAS